MKLERYKEEDLDKFIVPSHFTYREGGYWIPYVGVGFSLATMVNAVTGLIRVDADVNPDAVYLIAYDKEKEKYHEVHSLAFGREATEVEDVYSEYARWDTVNGWTTPL